MPLYEYICEKCEHCFEKMNSISNRNLPEEEPCPSCEEKSVQQKIGSGAIIDAVRLGVKKPPGQFRERMKQIKHNMKYDRKANIKDY